MCQYITAAANKKPSIVIHCFQYGGGYGGNLRGGYNAYDYYGGYYGGNGGDHDYHGRGRRDAYGGYSGHNYGPGGGYEGYRLYRVGSLLCAQL